MRAIRLCCCLLVLFFFYKLSSVSSRQFHVFPANVNNGAPKTPHSSPPIHTSNQIKEMKKTVQGSRPPSCEHKCYGCMPCEAIQVPTTSSSVGVQYTNYEPEGWKCKCGPTLYTP
ncbi:EPIDERMAL PATTERNING FACTOR-like protein 3 [Sesamum indicum]|uniref:Epidermal patterning factor-like protein n=1 Tax=Sesamum indicum TaxID=4182 RepID=A0A6I9SRM2_SESIN|nr:EPIDERMAL PATTERNING FACTOR-like protein 3 [Sesamum indicum]